MAKRKDLFTAADLARFCEVDLKTVHNWTARTRIKHFRTPGRHLRFRRADVIDFLRRNGYSVPPELEASVVRLFLLDENRAVAQATASALRETLDVTLFDDPLPMMLEVGRAAPDVIVMEAETKGVSATRILKALERSEKTGPTRLVVYTNSPGRVADALGYGATAVVQKPNTAELREKLEAMLGLGGHRDD